MKNDRKTVDDRQLKILNLVRSKGSVKAEEIAAAFQISLMTVRRDLQYLDERGLLKRVHGGALSLDKSHEVLTKEERILLCRDRISQYAARFIQDGDTIFINGSLTALNMLKYVGDKSVTVYTNNGRALEASYPAGVSVHFTGGELRNKIMVGEYVMRNLLTLNADKTFLGCAAVTNDGEFCYNIPTEIGINESMIGRTRKSLYILADHTKLLDRGSNEYQYGSCRYDRDYLLLTDSYADPDTISRLKQYGLNVHQVPVK